MLLPKTRCVRNIQGTKHMDQKIGASHTNLKILQFALVL